MGSDSRSGTLRFDDVAVDDALPPLEIPVTPTLIIAGAIASRDFQDVHHDRGRALERGSRDIFLNILTTNGLVGRFVTDWAGPEARLRCVDIRLGVPAYPGDALRFTGRVAAKVAPDLVTVEVRGANAERDHVTGTVDLALPVGGGTR